MENPQVKYVQRFTVFPRFLHFLVIISFLTLAVTGMALKFASETWAEIIAELLGSFEVLGALHRLMAVVTFIYFGLTFILMYQNWRKSGKSLLQFILYKDSMIPNLNDAKELVQTFRWFFGLGPQPQYGRWTYWEKFDFMAVFWGVAVIGGSLLWLSPVIGLTLQQLFIVMRRFLHPDLFLPSIFSIPTCGLKNFQWIR
jgi:cytochrome b subunit of formate dehydrogenase